MFIETKYISGYNSKQVAYPVGINKDSYTITSFFKQDINTLETETEHTVVKNWSYQEYNPKLTYKEGAKFSEDLFKGTFKECQQFIIDIVEIEGEWIRDERMNYIHVQPEEDLASIADAQYNPEQ
tara:strand:+ start:605 stop:979 length:375 start_codon:yes stop_codon:yes gene_type:complete